MVKGGHPPQRRTAGMYDVSKLSNLNYLFKILLNLSKFVKKLIKKRFSPIYGLKVAVLAFFPLIPPMCNI